MRHRRRFRMVGVALMTPWSKCTARFQSTRVSGDHPHENVPSLAGRDFPTARIPEYSNEPEVQVILGPQDDYFTAEGSATFLSSEYKVSSTSDRMGYRLQGPEIAHKERADIISDGIVLGSVQVPADRQPIVMMADHQTTGGYPKIATVISADIPLLAQCLPGSSVIKFKAITVEEAQARYRGMMKAWSLDSRPANS